MGPADQYGSTYYVQIEVMRFVRGVHVITTARTLWLTFGLRGNGVAHHSHWHTPGGGGFEKKNWVINSLCIMLFRLEETTSISKNRVCFADRPISSRPHLISAKSGQTLNRRGPTTMTRVLSAKIKPDGGAH
jgi:hypothetical protein